MSYGKLALALDRIAYFVVSNITGVSLGIPQIYDTKCETYRSYKRGTQDGLERPDLSPESFRGDPAYSYIHWVDRAYFIGSESMYNILRDAFRKQGLQYNIDYLRAQRDRNGRT